MFNDNYCIITRSKIYSQRTPHSKFIEFDLNGVKQNTYETLPIEIKKIIEINEDLNNYPEKYIEYTSKGSYIVIDRIKDFYCPYIKIPSHIDNLPVKELSEQIFEGIIGLHQVHLPNTIEKLSPFTFLKCINLETVNLPEKIKDIPHHCFAFCTHLTNIDLSNIERIGESAFADCTFLKKVNLDKIILLKRQAFINCENLEEIKINSDIEDIQELTFMNCKKLKTLILPDTIEVINKSAFQNCFELKEFNFPKNLKLISHMAFFRTSLKNIALPEGLDFISERAFTNENDKGKSNVYIYPTTKYQKNSFTKDSKITVVRENTIER